MVTLENNLIFQGHLPVGSDWQFRGLGYTPKTKHNNQKNQWNIYNKGNLNWVDNIIAKFSITDVTWALKCLSTNSLTKFRWPTANNESNSIKIIIFLEDWQPGQYMESNARPICKWAAGDFVAFVDAVGCHVNAGNHDWYVLELTGSL